MQSSLELCIEHIQQTVGEGPEEEENGNQANRINGLSDGKRGCACQLLVVGSSGDSVLCISSLRSKSAGEDIDA